jgi:hypothetical protein
MRSVISRCNICGQFSDSKKELKEHKDKNHRITDLKMPEVEGITNQEASNNN